MCEFCELVSALKHASDCDDKDGFETRYKCALVEETYRNGNFRKRIRHGAMELNYCPVCGQKMEL